MANKIIKSVKLSGNQMTEDCKGYGRRKFFCKIGSATCKNDCQHYVDMSVAKEQMDSRGITYDIECSDES